MMALVWSLLALGLALLAQSGLALLLADKAAFFDPCLIITVYVALTRGENLGMLTGLAGGWAHEIVFGGRLLGLLGLSRVVVAFVIGQAGRRFLLVSPVAHFSVLFAGALLDAWLVARLGAMFDVQLRALSGAALVYRALLNAVVGALAFQVAERRLRQEPSE
jgi:hypothetical protein